LQTVRADSVIFDDDFNNATNNLANNDLGVGGGFSSFSSDNGIDTYEAAGSAHISTSVASYNQASIDSINPININGGGTTVEFRGVTFSTNTPALNVDMVTADRLILGVTRTNGAGNWYANGSQNMPAGFWIQIMSDSIPQDAGSSGWTGTSTLFYKGTGTNLVELATWKFQNLSWSPAGPNNYAPVLDIKLTLSGTGWALNITGDVNTNGQPISFSGTYAGSGITNQLINGVNSSYIAAYTTAVNPPINMGIDEVKAYQVGSLAVTTPSFYTPEYGYNVNTVLAGEAVSLISSVTDSVATPTLKWQIEDMSSPGTFTDLPSGNATNVNVDTSALAGSVKGIQLVAKDGGISVTSAVVTLTVNAASAPADVLEPTPGYIDVYPGQGASFTALFTGNLPMFYTWQHSSPLDGYAYTNLPGGTNITYVIPSAADKDAGYYRIVASNSVGLKTSDSIAYANILVGTPAYLWSQAIPFGGLNSDQILTNFPSTYKIAGAMFATNGGLPIVVTTSRGNIVFGASGFSSATVTGGSGYASGAYDPHGIGASTNHTGNATFDVCLNDYYFGNTAHLITFSNLVVGSNYQVQLFGLDDRSGNNGLHANWQDPANPADVSMTYKMGDNVYVLGTFIASNTVQTIQQNLVDTNLGNFNCLVLRAVGWDPPPYWVYQPQNQGNFLGFNAAIIGIAAGDATITSPTITYQWKSGPVGGPYTNLTEGAKYTGTTTTSLTINNLTYADGNPVYVLAATNGGVGGRGLYSREAVLSVQGTPPGILDGSYAAYALSNNPAGFWMLNETNDPSTGVLLAYDSSGNGKHALYGSAVQDGFNGIQGPRPPAYPGFDTNEPAAKMVTGNSHGYMNLPALGFTNIEVTYAMWINPVSQAQYIGLLYARNTGNGTGTGGDQIGGFGYSNAGGVLGYNWNDNALTYTWSSGLAPVIGSWNFACLVIASNDATVYLYYLNGVGQPVLLKAVNNVKNTAVVRYTGGYILLGNDSYDLNGRIFNGSIAGAAIYNHALTENQLQRMFAAAVGITGNFAPAFATQPASTGVYPGNTVQFSATVSGTPPVTNQWTFNGTNYLVDGTYGGTIITGATSNVLTIANVTATNQGVYNLVLSNSVGSAVSSNAVLAIIPAPVPNLLGAWITGAANLADSSGYRLAGTHDGYTIGSTNYVFTNDVPAGASGVSLWLPSGNTAIGISNSATGDLAYTNTFDTLMSNSMTVTFWAKGAPGGGSWNPWISKYGENNLGWQYRIGTDGGRPVWTVRDGSSGTFTDGSMGPSWSRGGDQDDMHASFVVANTGIWHFYAGTYDSVLGVRKLYVDGVYGGGERGNTQYTMAAAEHVMIGGRENGVGSFGNYFTGEIYGVRLYSAALSTNQLNNLMIAGTINPPSAPMFTGGNPVVTTGPNGKQFVLTWSSGTLRSATNVAGPWTPVAGATSPYTNLLNITVPDMFYILSNP
jgi:hypothetical protein